MLQTTHHEAVRYHHLHHTWIVDVLVEIKVIASRTVGVGVVAMVTCVKIDVRCVVAKQQWWHQDAFLPQVSHEELQTNQSKDTEAKHRQDHDISQLLH